MGPGKEQPSKTENLYKINALWHPTTEKKHGPTPTHSSNGKVARLDFYPLIPVMRHLNTPSRVMSKKVKYGARASLSAGNKVLYTM